MSLHNKKRVWGIACIALAMVMLGFMPAVVQAQRAFPPLIVNCDQDLNDANQFENPCGFDDFIQLFVNLFDWGLAILSILSVVFFIAGGTMFLLSRGNENRVTQGKAILSNTLIGIVIALTSWLIVNTVIGLLIGNGTFKDVHVWGNIDNPAFGRNWWGVPSCANTYNEDCTKYTLKKECGDSKTSYVSELQRKLNSAPGCMQISVDGCFGPETEKAVMDFNKAAFGDDTPSGTAGKGTWDALDEGKGCNASVNNKVPADGTGCCVQKCTASKIIYGIDNTAQTNGTDGCLDLFPDGLWYDGSCNLPEVTSNNGEGCCVTHETSDYRGKCIQSSNKDWCTSGYKGGASIGGGGGTYFNNDCRQLVQCQGAPGAPIDYSCQQQ